MNRLNYYLEEIKTRTLEKVFHVSPNGNRASILKNGLSLSSNSYDLYGQQIEFKNRIYIAFDMASAKRIAQELYDFITNTNPGLKYMDIFQIDWRKFLKDFPNVKIYKDKDFLPTDDPDYDFHGAGGGYIKTPIPKQYVKFLKRA